MNHSVVKAASAVKNFVVAHKVPIAVVTTAATTAVVVKKALGTSYAIAEQFIAEKGLTEEFLEYIPTDI